MSGFPGYDNDSDGYNSDGGPGGRNGLPFLGAYITETSIPQQIDYAKNSILNLALGYDFAKASRLLPKDKDSLIEVEMTNQNIQLEPNDTDKEKLAKLNQLKEILQSKTRKNGGKRRKSKKYRKSKKQRKTKTKRRLRRSYKYK